ncbi:cytochrome P450 family protein [Synechococcus sp. CC9311]|nr:cytochrome P450 family protein [Synechococcus sp. CC9311]
MMAHAHLPTTGALTGVFESLAFFRDPSFAKRRFRAHGDVFETCLLGQRIVFIQGDQPIADLLAQGGCLEGWWPKSVQLLLGSRSLANRNGDGHKVRRRVVGQLFSSAALRRYTPEISVLVQKLVDELLNSTSPQPLAPRMRRFAFSVIANVVLGLDDRNRDECFADFEIWTKALFSIPISIPGTPFAQAMNARTRLLTRFKQLLANDTPLRGGLDLLRAGVDESGISLDDDDLAEQLLLLLFAGYETTASSLSCLFRALLIDPTVNTWLLSELDAKSAQDDLDRSLPRLDATVLEVMRLTPPVGGFFRRTKAPVILSGIEVSADRVIQVVLTPSSPSDDSDFFDFRPQRHLDGSFHQTLLPFGGGERVCLGKALADLEIRLMALGVLKNIELQLHPNQDLSLQQIPSPTPRDGLVITSQRRLE